MCSCIRPCPPPHSRLTSPAIFRYFDHSLSVDSWAALYTPSSDFRNSVADCFFGLRPKHSRAVTNNSLDYEFSIISKIYVILLWTFCRCTERNNTEDSSLLKNKNTKIKWTEKSTISFFEGYHWNKVLHCQKWDSIFHITTGIFLTLARVLWGNSVNTHTHIHWHWTSLEFTTWSFRPILISKMNIRREMIWSWRDNI